VNDPSDLSRRRLVVVGVVDRIDERDCGRAARNPF